METRMEGEDKMIMEKIEEYNKSMSQSESGKALMDAAAKLHESGVMNNLLTAVEDMSIAPKSRRQIAEYMNQALNDDSENGMQIFITMLEFFIADPTYAEHKNYFSKIIDAATEVDNSDIFKKYMEASVLFEKENPKS